jgi:hypothetical protein
MIRAYCKSYCRSESSNLQSEVSAHQSLRFMANRIPDIWEGKFDNLGCYLQELQKREY